MADTQQTETASTGPAATTTTTATTAPADNLPPSQATDAVLVKSTAMPADAQKVEELDFNKLKGRPITVDDLYQGMKHMGFQASAMAEAIRIINDMVGPHACSLCTQTTTNLSREHGRIPRRVLAPPSS